MRKIMGKEFEDYFSEIQADMVSICLENVENRAEKIYIYSSYENGHVASSCFYKINGMIVETHELNNAITPADVQYDVSDERQFKVLDILINDIKKLEEICKTFDKPMPTEIKIIYDVLANKLKAEYNYELMHSNTEDKTAYDFYDKWFEEIKNGEIAENS